MRRKPLDTIVATGSPPLTRTVAVSARSASIAFVRIGLGLFWLYEVTIGHNWKVGFFGFGIDANPGWIGPDAGSAVVEHGREAIEIGTWGWYQWALESVIMPNATVFAYVSVGLQIALALALIFGVFVRPFAALSLGLELTIYFLGNSRIPPFFTAGTLFVLVTAAGHYHGFDGVMSRRLADARSMGARALRWLIDLPLYRPQMRVPLASVIVLFSVYFWLQAPIMATQKMGLVAQELAAIGLLVAIGVFVSNRVGDRIALAASMLRIFVGYKLLHEIWTRVDPGVNALPGFAGVEAQREVFEAVSANHLAVAGGFIEAVILPLLGIWVVVFAVVQLGVGVALLLGWQTRIASAVGIGYLSVMMLLGLTRYAPFVLFYMIAVYALDSGRELSAFRFQEAMRPARYGLPIHGVTPWMWAGGALAALVVAVVAGVEVDGYATTVGGVTAAMTSMFCGMVAVHGWLRRADTVVLEVSEEEEEHRELAAIR
jgi:hypothetical protein